MHQFNFLIKPASSLCNLRCRYCFYEDVAENRVCKSYGLMSDETAQALLQAAFAGAAPHDTVTFSFQGGEPTLVGLPFLARFVALAARLCPARVTVHYSLQTNGLLLDEAWAAFFRANDFLIGLSLDGTGALHDRNRVDADQKGTYRQAREALALLQRFGVETNLLCVVTKQCARSAQRIYAALKETGVSHLQFIACLDPLEGARGGTPFSLSPEAYGRFLCNLFDAWYQDWKAGAYVSIRLFDDYVHLAMGLPAGTCATAGRCGDYFVVEGDGSLYPCDFFVLDQWRLGNLRDTSLPAAAQSERFLQFQQEGAHPPAACSTCPWQALCHGGCKRDWQVVDGVTVNYYCPAFRAFFAYAEPRLREIAQAEQAACGR